MNTRELHTVDLPNGRRVGFFDFEFVPAWAGSRLDPPESAEFEIECAFWVDGTHPVALTATELFALHVELEWHACVLARVEEITERRIALRMGERIRARSDAAAAAAREAAKHYSRSAEALANAKDALETHSRLPRWRWYRRRALRQYADLRLQAAADSKAQGDAYRAQAGTPETGH